jgi:DNA-binding transcriptional MerR regulator
VGAEAGKGFTAKQVQALTGLTARQLNDWDGRGALPHTREGTGWRRFSTDQLFILMVCTELRRKFGISVERLKYVIEVMNEEVIDPQCLGDFMTAAILMATVGGAVWLMTDFQESFVVDSEMEFATMWLDGEFSGEDASALAFVKLNPIVNAILSSADSPARIPTDDGDELKKYRLQFGATTAEEYEVLQMVRSGEYERVEIVSPNGKIRTVKGTKRPDVSENLQDLLRRHDYQKITVTKRDGQVVNVEQEVLSKPSNQKPKNRHVS